MLDVLRAMPEGAPVPTSLAEVLAPRLARLDRSIHTNHALLSRMPAAHGRRIDRDLRARPELAMDVADWLDQRAAEVGVPADNRLRLRHSAMTVGTRMRRQSTNAVVQDCVAKLDEAVVQQTPLDADLRTRTARVVDVLWQQVSDGTPQWGTAPPPDTGSGSGTGMIEMSGDAMVVPQRFGAHREMEQPTEPVQWNESWARPGDEEVRLGTILMPLGLVTCGITLIVGLIVFIVGESQNGNWDGVTHAEDAVVQ